jgi:hypothetical protein
VDVDRRDHGPRRPGTEAYEEPLQYVGWAFGDALDRAVLAVGNPTPDAQAQGLAAREVAKADALDPTTNARLQTYDTIASRSALRPGIAHGPSGGHAESGPCQCDDVGEELGVGVGIQELAGRLQALKKFAD